MKRFLALFLSAVLLLSPFAYAQSGKPVAALGRVAVLGEITEAEKKIITNRMENFLSKSYELISQEEYLRAEEAAFAALDESECTEANCIRKIQEILQIERLFILQIIREGALTQLSLSLFKEEARSVAEEICEDCGLTQIYTRVEGLVNRLVTEDLAAEGIALPAPKPVAQPKDEGGIPWWVWVAGGLGVAALAGAAGGATDAATETGSVTINW